MAKKIMSRVNVKSVLTRSVVKSASKFITDVQTGEYMEPNFIRLSDDDSERFYEFNDVVSSVVNRIVDDCVKVEPQVRSRDKNAKLNRRLKNRIKEVETLLDNPNENKESFFEIREQVLRDMLVPGRGAIEKVNRDDGKLLELYAVIGKDVKVDPDESGNLKTMGTYFLKDPKGKDGKRFDFNELIFMVFRPISRSLYGIKPMDAIANSVASDILRATYNTNFFMNNGEAAGVLQLDGMSNTELKRFRQYWQSNFKGAKNAHKMAAVNVPINFVRMAMTNKDMEFGEYGRELRQKIYSAYKMQPIIMGVVDSGTGKLNSEQQVQLYKDGALKPILRKEQYYYNKEIVQMGLGIDDVVIEFGDVDLADAVTQAGIDRTDAQNAILTINEIRARRGMVPVKWGDAPVITLPGGGQIDPETGLLVNPNGQQENNPTPKKPAKKEEKTLFKKYANGVKIRVEALIEHFKSNEELKKIEFSDISKPRKLVFNGKEYEHKVYTFPVKLKELSLYKFVEQVTDFKYLVKDSSVLTTYFECLSSRIKSIIFSNFVSGSTNNIVKEIDTTIYEESFNPIVSDIF